MHIVGKSTNHAELVDDRCRRLDNSGMIEDGLRKAVSEALRNGWKLYRIADDSGVARATLQEWHTLDGRTLSLQNAEKLADWLGCRLTKPKIPKP